MLAAALRSGSDATDAADADLAERLARTAGELLLILQQSDHFEGKPLGAAGDAVSQAFLSRALAVARPDDGLLSEEAAADPVRLNKARTWIIDPLDGTREYSEGRSDWAVHIALAINGEATVGAVALPGRGLVLTSAAPLYALQTPERPRMVVSRTRPGADSVAVAQVLDAKLISMGSAGAKAMSVVCGEADIYLHSGGQYEWDSCAPAAVAKACGLHVSRIDGSPLIYNRPDPYLPDLLICRPEWADRILALVSRLTQLSGRDSCV